VRLLGEQMECSLTSALASCGCSAAYEQPALWQVVAGNRGKVLRAMLGRPNFKGGRTVAKKKAAKKAAKKGAKKSSKKK
jgi:hypothetical protein